MEIEAGMAADKRRVEAEAARDDEDAKKEERGKALLLRRQQGAGPVASASAVRRVATQGAVRRPLTPRVGRGF